MKKTSRAEKGVSTVFGSILFIILALTLASTLYLALYEYNRITQEALILEETRKQERITLVSLDTENVTGTEYITAVWVNNTGSVTSRIRAVYIDNEFICDPSDPNINPEDTYINAKESRPILLPDNIEYEPLSKIIVATERGIKSIEYMWKLKGGSQEQPPSETQRLYFGPLLLNFEKFYYTECNPDGFYDPNSWKPGWSVEKGARVVWNITVTNIDDRAVTINKYSAFTLVSNDGGGQRPWYIEPLNGLDTLRIEPNQTVTLIYIWDRPRLTQGVSTQTVYNQPDRNKVFLTFMGFFHERDGTTKPYGQTIPFEAVLVREPQMVITANPTVIAAGSTMTSTITVIVRNIYGAPAANVQVSFTTTLGSLSSTTATTNADGVASVILYPGYTTGTATITATWQQISKSTTVTIAPGTLTVSGNPNTVPPATTITSTITAVVQLNGNPLPGETVTFSVTPEGLGTIQTEATTDNQGRATVVFTPGITTGVATITATWGTLTASTTVTIAEATLTVQANPVTVAASSTMYSTITARLTLNGAPLVGQQITFTAEPADLGTIQPQATTNNQGYASVNFTPGTTTGEVTITATWGTLTASTTVIIAQGNVALSPESLEIYTDSSQEITVLVELNGNPVANALVTFTTTIGSLSETSAVTNESGYATVTFFSPTEQGNGYITATWEGISASIPVTVTEAQP